MRQALLQPERPAPATPEHPLRHAAVLAVGLAAAIAVAYVAQPIVLPVVLAMVAYALVQPVLAGLTSRVGRGPAVAAACALPPLVVGLLVAAAVGLLLTQEQQLRDSLPQMKQAVGGWLARGRTLGLPVPSMEEARLGEQAANALGQAGLGATSVLYSLIAGEFLLVLLCLERGAWRDKLARSIDPRLPETLHELLAHIRTYYLTRTVTCVVSGVVSGVWLGVLGVPSAPLWGALVALMNYLPTIGSWISAIPPVLVAAFALGPGHALAAAAGLFVQEQLVGNLLDPMLQGRNLKLAPSVILVAVVGFGLLWGVMGAFVAVPFMVFAVGLLELHEPFKPALKLLKSEADDPAIAHTARRGALVTDIG